MLDAFFSLGFYELLLLIMVANGTPVIASKLLADKFHLPVDLGYCFMDGRRLLGDSKTWRGLLAAMVVTAVVAYVTGYSLVSGLLIAIFAMLGDMFSSFIKRRLNIPSSAMALFLDQVPECLLPALLFKDAFALDYGAVFMLVCLFVIVELLLSSLLFKWGIRRRPY